MHPPQITVKLKNFIDGDTQTDRLHQTSEQQQQQTVRCSAHLCTGSLMNQPDKPKDLSLKPRTKDEILRQAKQFLEGFYASLNKKNSVSFHERWRHVQDEINFRDHYELTEEELTYGCKQAWRNASRCIGRIQWTNLKVFDCRHIRTTKQMFNALKTHIAYATNDGNIRSTISIFPCRRFGYPDVRLWNQQLISYAGYRQPDGSCIGDPINIEFTEICLRLGWKPRRTPWDVLPLVLSCDDSDPDLFEIPNELVLQVPLTHPKYDWFEDLELRWYALPAVSGMSLDCGGVIFPAAPFNGWYMSTEIGCRDLADEQRLNVLEKVALKMGMDTSNPITLWKDKAVVELNIAVLSSFQKKRATIVDHHTAAASFMEHCSNEQRLRGGCPADWVWIVPPMSASLTPVFHQEMLLYHLNPSFNYQVPAWRTHEWKRPEFCLQKPQIHIRAVIRAALFACYLYGSALKRRTKATILYATETGKAKSFARQTANIFAHSFNSKVYCMNEYDFNQLQHEKLILIITSTFGNGDSPENGEMFGKELLALVNSRVQLPTDSLDPCKVIERLTASAKDDDNTDDVWLANLKQEFCDRFTDSTRPLHNLRYAVFALGSSAYPNFCAYGHRLDRDMARLGAKRVIGVVEGDELAGQKKAFRQWVSKVFPATCLQFQLKNDTGFIQDEFGTKLSVDQVRFVEARADSLPEALSKYHNENVTTWRVLRNRHIADQGTLTCTSFLELGADSPGDNDYQPGWHVGIIPANNSQLVDRILARLTVRVDPDIPVQLEVQKDKHTANGVLVEWEAHDSMPCCSLRTLITWFFDINNPLLPIQLEHLAAQATNPEEKKRLMQLASDPEQYEEWRTRRFPHLMEILDEFPSVQLTAALLITQLNPLRPRYYSISCSPEKYSDQIHLTVGLITYKTEDGKGPMHYGVCSNYLNNCRRGEKIHLFIRSSANFSMPQNVSSPIMMIGPGTGIAPFRGFWQHRQAQMQTRLGENFGPMWLLFGCRLRILDYYRTEKETMLKQGVLSRLSLALSREPDQKRTYVQHILEEEANAVAEFLLKDQCHVYVCGDCSMADDVHRTLQRVLALHPEMSDEKATDFMKKLKEEKRYHEDIFGISLRVSVSNNSSSLTSTIQDILPNGSA